MFPGEELLFAHRGGIDKLDAERRLPACRNAGPHAEAVGVAFLEADAEESFVVKSGPFMGMSGIDEAHVVRIAVEGAVVPDLDPSESLPTLQGILGELEGAVLDEFGIQAAVGSEIDVLKEDAVHGRLDRGSRFGQVDVDGAGGNPGRQGHCHAKGEDFVQFHIKYRSFAA